MIVKLTDLGYKAGNKFILKDVNWEIQRGEHWAVLGLNGSGKTTLLSIVTGYRKNTHGKLEVFGEEFTEENILDLRKRIGWVSSSFLDNLYSKETALEIVLSGCFATLGVKYEISDNDVVRAQELLTALDLKAKIGYPYDIMSKGERQKVLIARALMANPELLVLDEPCTGLDIFAREQLLNTIDEMAISNDITIIYVTHHTEEILPIFKHTLLMKKGRVHSKGATKEIITAENLSDFFNSPVRVDWYKERVNINIDVKTSIKNAIR